LGEWFEAVFQRRPGERRALPEALIIGKGDVVTVEFLEDEPRVVQIRKQRRPCINVKLATGEIKTLWLSHIDLAEKVALLQQEVGGSLKGVKVLIKNLGQEDRRYRYEVVKK